MASVRPLFILVLVFGVTAAVHAQTAPRRVQVANPGAIEFEVEGSAAPVPALWHIELLRASDAPATAQPVKAWDSGSVQAAGARVRVELAGVLDDVPDGEYVATIRVAGPGGPIGVAGPFIVYGHGATAASAGKSPEERRNERKWTRVAIAIGASILLIPLVVR
ncbi:MAG: hypothetical protein JSU08_06455 [Acidobacteria bacterium]|nr:hypothetical protein [Acidobacteriota bacterium]